MSESPLDRPLVQQVLDAADDLAVCILTKRGPHTTPELFTVASGALWCLTAATTLKAKVLADGGPVAVTASAGGMSVIATGTADVVDSARPLHALRNLGTSAAAPAAVGQFAMRNAAELTGAVVDLFTGKLGGPLPPRRVVIRITPTATAVIDPEGNVVEAAGWEEPGESADAAATVEGDQDALDAIPERLRDLTGDGVAVLGWATASGRPLALPAQWRSERGVAEVSSALFDLTSAARSSRASVTRDTWTGFGPSGKQGVMVRGRGTAAEMGDRTLVTVAIDGVAYWDGIETGGSRTRS